MRIEGVKTRKDAAWYLGKKVAYTWTNESKIGKPAVRKVIWGRVAKAHGNSGAVQARFITNLPPHAIGKLAKVFLYPSNL